MSTVADAPHSHLSPTGVLNHATGSVTFMRLPSSRYQSDRTPATAPGGINRVLAVSALLVCALTQTGMATIGSASAADMSA
jgi:hypothetical protein